MKKLLALLLLLCAPLCVSAQDAPGKGKTDIAVKAISPLSLYSNRFEIDKIYFNRKIDLGGRGEVLETTFQLKNLIDAPQDLYVFVVATYEKKQETSSSFEGLIPLKEKLRSFVPFPFDMENFRYSGKDGTAVYKKYPRNPRTGVNPLTGTPYRLTDKLIIRTEHLSRYRNNYFFFNNAAILIFNSKGEPVFKQLYELRGWRR